MSLLTAPSSLSLLFPNGYGNTTESAAHYVDHADKLQLQSVSHGSMNFLNSAPDFLTLCQDNSLLALQILAQRLQAMSMCVRQDAEGHSLWDLTWYKAHSISANLTPILLADAGVVVKMPELVPQPLVPDQAQVQAPNQAQPQAPDQAQPQPVSQEQIPATPAAAPVAATALPASSEGDLFLVCRPSICFLTCSAKVNILEIHAPRVVEPTLATQVHKSKAALLIWERQLVPAHQHQQGRYHQLQLRRLTVRIRQAQ